ncbi:MAG: sodium-dependent transporter [Gemmatimonadales bacterium]
MGVGTAHISPARPSRQLFTSRFGVVMSFIGVAVGLGNVWRFPYMVGAFGGGAFLLVYLVLLCGFGIPAILAELTLGRMTGRSTMGAFARVGMPGGRAVGWLLFVTVLMATSYYTVIVGWVLKYLVISLTGEIMSISPESFFNSVLGGFAGQFLMTGIVVLLAGIVLVLGIRKGVERISTVGMPLLFLLLLVLIGRSAMLPGAAEGFHFYLVPDFAKINSGVLTAALGQVFFSLSLGGTFLVTYASYLPEHVNLKRTAITVGIGETLAAVLAGFVIVPAAVAFGLEMSSGPPLTFVTAPAIFEQIPAGAVFAALFFGLLFFAAFLSDVAALEVLVSAASDELGMPRNRAVLIFCIATLVLGSIGMVSLDYILKSDLVWGSIMQPVGSALALVALAWVVGQGRALEAANVGNDDAPVGKVWLFWIKWVVPAGIALILALGVKGLFEAFVT